MISDLPMDKPLPTLSAIVHVQVYAVPNGMGTWGGGNKVFLEQRYVNRLHTGYLAKGNSKKAAAKAWYFLLHEVHHALTTAPYWYPLSEIRANAYAAKHFVETASKWWTYSDAEVLWHSLPDYYRNPTNV